MCAASAVARAADAITSTAKRAVARRSAAGSLRRGAASAPVPRGAGRGRAGCSAAVGSVSGSAAEARAITAKTPKAARQP